MTPFCGDLRLLRSVLQAIYPTVIIVLVALKRSPIDTGGLSQVCLAPDYQADLGGPSLTDKVSRNSATIVFHHSTFCSLDAGDTEDAGGDGCSGLPDRLIRSPPSSVPVDERDANDIRNIV